jgi:rare lipoprotein A
MSAQIRRCALLVAAVSIACSACGSSSALRAGVIGAREQGKATYYSPRLAGHRTASGERYDPNLFTAAHPVIPFGTYVQVVRTDGVLRGVVVRINDRCAGRKKIIDLSQAAARQIDMLRAGIVPVEIEIVPAPQPPR